ncbi:MAG: hypothetical protein ABRQ26_11530 [Syntrophomonadaceae bacterium]
MWNKRRNFFIWVKIRTSSRFGFVFPLMMPVIEETLEEIHESFSLLKPLLKGVKPSVAAAMDMPRAGLEMIREVRCLGPCSLVEVHSKEVKVDIRLI